MYFCAYNLISVRDYKYFHPDIWGYLKLRFLIFGEFLCPVGIAE